MDVPCRCRRSEHGVPAKRKRPPNRTALLIVAVLLTRNRITCPTCAVRQKSATTTPTPTGKDIHGRQLRLPSSRRTSAAPATRVYPCPAAPAAATPTWRETADTPHVHRAHAEPMPLENLVQATCHSPRSNLITVSSTRYAKPCPITNCYKRKRPPNRTALPPTTGRLVVKLDFHVVTDRRLVVELRQRIGKTLRGALAFRSQDQSGHVHIEDEAFRVMFRLPFYPAAAAGAASEDAAGSRQRSITAVMMSPT